MSSFYPLHPVYFCKFFTFPTHTLPSLLFPEIFILLIHSLILSLCLLKWHNKARNKNNTNKNKPKITFTRIIILVISLEKNYKFFLLICFLKSHNSLNISLATYIILCILPLYHALKMLPF